MYWLEVSVVTDGEGAEAVAEALRPFAYNEGVVLEQLGDAANPDPEALEAAVTVKIYRPEDADTPAIRRRIEEVLYHLGRLYPLPPPTFRKLEEQDWANAWKEHYHPFRVGNRIWIQPSWQVLDQVAADEAAEPGPTNAQEDRIRPQDVVLTLDPGMAFGTGLHPTTQMCLQALAQLVQPGMRLLDVGTGSGILAIAGAKLGAESLLAIDIDKVAVGTAVANAEQNSVLDRITVRQGTLAMVLEKGWDIVVVNILAPVIVTLLREAKLLTYVARDGHLILSGIIDQQASDIEAAVANAGGEVRQRYTIRDWITFIVGHADVWEPARFR